jgi:class 3 adenylate cyclase
VGEPLHLPTGTVTFLFTDLEGSTGPQQAHPDAYGAAVRRHHDLLRGAVEAHGGVVFETVGDAVYAAFAAPTAAVAAALAGQLALHCEPWGATGPLRARMGIHLGEVEAYPAPGAAQGARYLGLPLVRCARLMATAHGGQTVLSEAATALVRDALPPDAGLRDLGEHRLKDLSGPERVAQLLHPELPADFPPLRTLDALPHNLPLQLTSFVGRERELAAVREALAAHRLVTLTGAGGCGKTRLALQAAADGLEAWPDGVWFVDLAPLADSALVPRAALAALGLGEAPGRAPLERLTDALRPGSALLLLDNCEHLLDACARPADLIRAVERTPFGRAEVELACRPTPGDLDEVEGARRVYVRAWQGRHGLPARGRMGWRFERAATRSRTAVDDWRDASHLWAVAERLRSVQLECDDALRVIARFDAPGTLFYIDPPYPASTRCARWRTRAYAHELTDDDHRRLAGVLRGVGGLVVLSSAPCALYRDLYPGWTLLERRAQTQANRPATEALWLSPRAAERLRARQLPLPEPPEAAEHREAPRPRAARSDCAEPAPRDATTGSPTEATK